MGSSPSRRAARRAARRCGRRPRARSSAADDLVRDLYWRVCGGADGLRVRDGVVAASFVALVQEAAGDVAEEVFVAADAVCVEAVAAGDARACCELLDARALVENPG